MVNPPEAEPVSAASTLVATASDTSGPPSIPTTQSRTTAKAGKAATTAPKPTRLATLSAGSADAFAPASSVRRNAAERQGGNQSRGGRVAVVAVVNLRWIELARGGRALAHVLIVGGRVGLYRG